MPVAQIRTTWTGGPSDPGLTVMNVDAGAVLDFSSTISAVRTFWTAIAPGIPDEYDLQVSPLVELFDTATGALMGESTLTGNPAVVSGTSTERYVNGVGARIDWLTSDIVNGRRVRGRTFLVPIHSLAFTNAGALEQLNVTVFEDAATDLLTALDTAGTPLVVWSRPTPPAADGAIAPVIAARVPNKAAYLRGRRG